MSLQRKVPRGGHSLDPRFAPLVQLLAEVRLRVIREAAARQSAKQR